VLWFTSGRGVEKQAFGSFSELEIERVRLALEPPSGGAPSKLALLIRTVPAFLTARRAMLRHGSKVLVGLGGFTSLPAVLAARNLDIPIALYEANAVAGAATRRLGSRADRILSAWPLAQAVGAKHIHSGPILDPGVLRAAETLTRDVQAPRSARRDLGFEPDRPLLVVLGGSQGAGGLNRFMAAVAHDLVDRGVQVLHQTGPGREGEGADSIPGYIKCGWVAPVHRSLQAATVVLCRGGAATLAEVGALGIPALVVPYPHHPDRHQEKNASCLGAGVEIVAEDDLGPVTVERLLLLLGEAGAGERARMSQALRTAVPRDGAQQVWRVIQELAGIPPESAAGL